MPTQRGTLLQQCHVFGPLAGQAFEAAQQVGQFGTRDAVQAGDGFVVLSAQLVARFGGGGYVAALHVQQRCQFGNTTRPDSAAGRFWPAGCSRGWRGFLRR